MEMIYMSKYYANDAIKLDDVQPEYWRFFHRFLFVFFLLLICSSAVYAACTSVPKPMLTMSPPSPLTWSGPGADANPVGSNIGGWGGAGREPTVFQCSTGNQSQSTWVYSVASKVQGVVYSEAGKTYDVFPTGVQGLGYIVGVGDAGGSVYMPMTDPKIKTYQGNFSHSLGFRYQLKFVITGRLTTGTYVIPAQRVGRVTVEDYNSSGNAPILTSELWLSAVTINVSVKTCTVTTPSINETIPIVNKSAFNGSGSSAGGKDFKISLMCPASLALGITLSDVQNRSNTSSVLSLDSSSTTSGIGLQVLRNSGATLVSYGPDSSAIGTVNQWMVGTVVGNVDIPLRVHYVQTAPNIVGGRVSAKASFTMSYQ